jgi:aminoglycoside phosphotransferase family enzyme/predicted kinase
VALPDILTGLLLPAAYPHACGEIRVVETHISWVFLTGEFAYKIKKPVRLTFLDFSTLELRRHFCEEELRCNRRFAPELYLAVVPILRDPQGGVRVASDGRIATSDPDRGAGPGGRAGTVVEWAVRMVQFAPHMELDHLLAAGALDGGSLHAFGARLAALHAGLPSLMGGSADVPGRVLAPVEENFATLGGLDLDAGESALLSVIQRATGRLVAAHGQWFAERFAGGWVRECHGDLHLGNLVLRDGVVTAFDCLEFDANLRWIDVQSDLAFLFMDCLVRGRADLAYELLDGYLDASGDYAGAALLPFYAAYRAMVRAKVAGIQRRQLREAGAHAAAEAAAGRLRAHLEWTARWLARPPGGVVLMCGVSGSGKSWLAERLVGPLAALRLRSDVARRAVREAAPAAANPGGDPRAAGVPADRRELTHVDTGRYAPDRVDAVYGMLAERLEDLVSQGETVILDATFIRRTDRQRVLERARRRGWNALILLCVAPRPVLEARIRQRLVSGRDPSEADVAVLDRQLARQELPGPEEPVLEIDTTAALDPDGILRIRDAVVARLGRVRP